MALLESRASLPAKSIMLEDSTLKVTKKRHAHKLTDQQWTYNDSLAIAGGFDRLPSFYEVGYKAWLTHKSADVLHYKDFTFIISEDGQAIIFYVPE